MSAAWVSTWFRGIGVAVAWPVLAAAMATMAGLVWLALSRRARVSPTEWILMAWVVLYALVLSAPVHEFYVQYALPLAPPAAMLAGRGAVAAAEWLGDGVRRGAGLSAAALAVLVLGVVVFTAGANLLATRSRLLTREETSDAVFLGRWLECRAPASTRVAYDYFSYVPPIFRDATPTWGGTREWLVQLRSGHRHRLQRHRRGGDGRSRARRVLRVPGGRALRLRARVVARRVHDVRAGGAGRRAPRDHAGIDARVSFLV